MHKVYTVLYIFQNGKMDCICYVFEVPDAKDLRQMSDRVNVSLCFASGDMACLADGTGNLFLLNTGCRLTHPDAKWTVRSGFPTVFVAVLPSCSCIRCLLVIWYYSLMALDGLACLDLSWVLLLDSCLIPHIYAQPAKYAVNALGITMITCDCWTHL